MGKNGSDKSVRSDSRAEGGGISEERVEIAGPRVVRRAVKLRFGGVSSPNKHDKEEAPPAARPEPPAAELDRRPVKRSSAPPPPLDVELDVGSQPPRAGRRLRPAPAAQPSRRFSVAPSVGISLVPGVSLVVIAIVVGLAGRALDISLGPVRPTWIAGALLLAGVGIIFYRMLPRDR